MIQTEHLTIRRVEADDWKAIREIWAAVAGTWAAQYDTPNDLSDEAAEQRIRRWALFGRSRERRFYAVCLGEQVIGYYALHLRKDTYELGYCFHPAFHGKGLAREGLAAVLDEMAPLKQEGITGIEAGTALANTPSVRLLLSLGFRQTGTEKVSFYKDEEGRDIVFDGGRFLLAW